jgi:O-antigen ligase
MQITDSFSNRPPLSTGGGTSDLEAQIKQHQAYYRRLFLQQRLAFWWPRLLLIVVACLIGVYGGQILAALPINIVIAICGGLLLLPVFIAILRHPQFALLVFTLGTTALAPKIVTVKSADVYPSVVFIGALFCIVLVQAAFSVRKVFLPPLRAYWPHLFLIFLAIISNVVVQAFWTHGVPHKINSNPIIYDEVLGCIVFCFPVMTYVIVCMIVSTNERLIRYIQRIFIIAALLTAAVVLYDFKRIGADIYTFRFSEPHIFWMSLRAIAQLLALGFLLGYVRFLMAPNGRVRLLYGVITVVCLVCVILCLENSWWLEVGIGAIVVTIVYSRRLLVTYIVLILPFAPLLKAEFEKLQSVKTDDAVRLIIWQDSLRVWSKQRLLGVGPGNFWAYDQAFTNLPRALRNCNATGLCVAHNGYLQILGECGPVGLFLFIAFPVIIMILAYRLYRRSRLSRKYDERNIFTSILSRIGLDYVVVPERVKNPREKRGFWRAVGRAFCDDYRSERHEDHMLALAVLGLTAGSLVADFFAGGFFIPPRQISVLTEMPQVVTSWIMWGILMYKDQKWRLACIEAKRSGTKAIPYQTEGGSF